jgi:hypothetical protein
MIMGTDDKKVTSKLMQSISHLFVSMFEEIEILSLYTLVIALVSIPALQPQTYTPTNQQPRMVAQQSL